MKNCYSVSHPSMIRWHKTPDAMPRVWRLWLSERTSLTARLQAHCQHFRVQCLRHTLAIADRDVQRALGLRAARPVWCRDVVLWCDEQPVVFARTLVSAKNLRHDWPFFHGLGNHSLGARLFADPRIQRLPMQYAVLKSMVKSMGSDSIDFLGARIRQSSNQSSLTPLIPAPSSVYARRSIFMRGGGKMLVTEIFLPSVLQLSLRESRRQPFSKEKNL